MRAFPAATRSPWTATFSRRRSRAPSIAIHASRSGARKSASPGRGYRDRGHRPAYQRRAGRRNRAPHWLRAACSSTTASAPSWMPIRWIKRSPSALRAMANRLDGTGDYLNCPFDRDAVRALRGCAARGPGCVGAHRRGDVLISKLVCRLRSSRAAAAIRCASVP